MHRKSRIELVLGRLFKRDTTENYGWKQDMDSGTSSQGKVSGQRRLFCARSSQEGAAGLFFVAGPGCEFREREEGWGRFSSGWTKYDDLYDTVTLQPREGWEQRGWHPLGTDVSGRGGEYCFGSFWFAEGTYDLGRISYGKVEDRYRFRLKMNAGSIIFSCVWCWDYDARLEQAVASRGFQIPVGSGTDRT